MSHENDIAKGIYLIGGPGISHADDAASFIIDFGGELVMIDTGAGRSSKIIQQNIEGEGLNPGAISTLILTHCHIDHIGSALYFRDQFGCRILIHDLDADALETGDASKTAASWYGTELMPINVDERLTGEHAILNFGGETLHCLHTPGHTPGSISLYLDRGGRRILFGQDIHGPFHASFGSDIGQWRESMEKLLALKADVLCEGHFGVFRPAERVRQYIEEYLEEYS